MTDKPKTGCECPLAGYCERHGMNKHVHNHTLCQNHEGYFNMWEEGRGPGQPGKPAKPVPPNPAQLPQACPYCGKGPCNGQCRNKQQLPSAIQMAKNLAVSAKDHAKSGFQTSSEEEIARRLEICGDCEHFVPESSRCSLCGCFAKLKAKLKSGKCPINKW
jgi:hypothetical protein